MENGHFLCDPPKRKTCEGGVWGGLLILSRGCQYSAAGLCCLSIPLGMQNLLLLMWLAWRLSIGCPPQRCLRAGAALELSDSAYDSYRECSDALPVTALTAVTKSSCSGFNKPVQPAEGCRLSFDANGMHIEHWLPCNVNRYVCQAPLPISTWPRTLPCQQSPGATAEALLAA